MNEQMLIDFLHGKVAAAELGAALIASRLEPDAAQYRTTAPYRATPPAQPAEITPQHIETLLGALETGALSEEQVSIAAFLLEAAPEQFLWYTDTVEGERVGRVLFWLGDPTINYPLTHDNLAAFRRYPRTGESVAGGGRAGQVPNPLMQPTNAGATGLRPHPDLRPATMDRRFSQVVCS